MSKVYELRKKPTVNYSCSKKSIKKNVQKVDKILIETGLQDNEESSEAELKLNLSVDEEKSVVETCEIGLQDKEEACLQDNIGTENHSKNFHSFPDLRSKEFMQIKENCPFNLIKVVQNEKELDQFFRIEFPYTYIKKSHKVGCSECQFRRSGHDMRKQVRLCKCKNPQCFIEFKIHICEVSGNRSIYQKGFDIHNHAEILKGDIHVNASKRDRIMANGIHIGKSINHKII